MAIGRVIETEKEWERVAPQEMLLKTTCIHSPNAHYILLPYPLTIGFQNTNRKRPNARTILPCIVDIFLFWTRCGRYINASFTFEIRNSFGRFVKWFIYYFRVECNELVRPAVKQKKTHEPERLVWNSFNWLPTIPFSHLTRSLSLSHPLFHSPLSRARRVLCYFVEFCFRERGWI